MRDDEAYLSLPDCYHQKEIILLPKVYMDPIDKILPSGEPAFRLKDLQTGCPGRRLSPTHARM
jgi:hypothetical protein